MKLTLNLLEKRKDDQDRRWPAYIGGRVRTSTLVLIVAFLAAVVGLQRVPPARAVAQWAAVDSGGPAGFCARSELHLGTAQPGAGAAVHRDADAHPDTDDHHHNALAAAAVAADRAPAAVRPAHQHHDAAARSGSASGASETAATAARVTVTPRRAASSPGGLTGYSDTHGYTGDP